IDALGFAQQEWNMEISGFHKSLDDLSGLLEFLDELVMLLVAPGVAQGHQLAVQHRHSTVKVVVELLQIMGKSAEFLGVDDSVRHCWLLLVRLQVADHLLAIISLTLGKKTVNEARMHPFEDRSKPSFAIEEKMLLNDRKFIHCNLGRPIH